MKPTAYQHLRNTVLRGGRMTKVKGLTASIAPMVGAVILPGLVASVSPIALAVGGVMMGAGAAGAQSVCTDDAGAPVTPGTLTVTCSGGLPEAMAEQFFNSGADALVVAVESDFSV